MGGKSKGTVGEAGRLGGRTLLLLAGCFAAIVVLWRSPIVWPMKLPLVVVHELMQGAGAVLSGGSLGYLEVYPQESGLAFTEGGSIWLIYNAGYLGSLLVGALLLLLGGRPKLGRIVVFLIGALVGFATFRFIPSGSTSSFGFIGGLVAAGALMVAALFLPAHLHAFLGRLLGLCSCGYAVLDIASDLFLGSTMRSDARMLADLTAVPLALWCGVWLALSLGVAGAILWTSWRKK